MSNARKEMIESELDQIITNITGFSLTDPVDSENVALCRRYALSNVFYHRYMDTNSHEVQRHLAEICQKLGIHALFDASDRLRSLWTRFVDGFDWSTHIQYDIQWRLLSFLLHASGRPSALHELGLRLPEGQEPSSSPTPRAAQEDDAGALDLSLKAVYSASVDSDRSLSDWSDVSGDEQCHTHGERQLSQNHLKNKQTHDYDVSVCGDVTSQPVDIELARQWLYRYVVPPYSEYRPYHSCHAPELPELLAIYRRRLGLAGPLGPPAPLAERRVCRELLWQLMAPGTTRLLVPVTGSGSCPAPKHCDGAVSGVCLSPKFRIYGLTQRASAKMLGRFCSAIDHVHYLRDSRRLSSTDSESGEPGSNPGEACNLLTYRAFYQSVSEQLKELDRLLVRLHDRLLSSSSVFTVITLYNRLRRWFSLLKFLYTVQRRGINAVSADSPAWLKSMRLVSVLYSVVVQGDNVSAWSPVARDIFVSTTRPLLRIVSHWMSFEVFTDLTSEFFLSRNADVSVNDPSFWSSGFLTHYCIGDGQGSAGTFSGALWRDRVEPLPFLLSSIRHIVETAKCIRILDRLKYSQVFDGETLFRNLDTVLCESAGISHPYGCYTGALCEVSTEAALNTELQASDTQIPNQQSVTNLPSHSSEARDKRNDSDIAGQGHCEESGRRIEMLSADDISSSAEAVIGACKLTDAESSTQHSASANAVPDSEQRTDITDVTSRYSLNADNSESAANADISVTVSCDNAAVIAETNRGEASKAEYISKADIYADTDQANSVCKPSQCVDNSDITKPTSLTASSNNNQPINCSDSHILSSPAFNSEPGAGDSPFHLVLSAENDPQLAAAFSPLAAAVDRVCCSDIKTRRSRDRRRGIPFVDKDVAGPGGFLTSSSNDSVTSVTSMLDECVPLSPPLSVVLKHRLSSTIATHCATVCRRLVAVLFEEYRLAEHLSLLRCVCLCSVDGLVSQLMHAVLEESPHLVYPVHSSSTSSSASSTLSVRWTLCLQSCVAPLHADFGSLFSVAALGPDGEEPRLRVRYTAPWPVSLLLDGRCVDLYSELFVFVASLKHCLRQLESLRFTDLCARVGVTAAAGGVASVGRGVTTTVGDVARVGRGVTTTVRGVASVGGGVTTMNVGVTESYSILIHRMHLLRSWLLNFVATIHSHVMLGIMQCSSERFILELRQSCSVGKLMNVHERYLCRLRRFCLLDGVHERRVHSTIVRALVICRRLVAIWQPTPTPRTGGMAEAAADGEGGGATLQPCLQLVSQLEAQYAHVHYFLSLYLQQFRTQIAHLEPLAVALVHSSPCQVPQEELAKLEPR